MIDNALKFLPVKIIPIKYITAMVGWVIAVNNTTRSF